MTKAILFVCVCSLFFTSFASADDASARPKELTDLQSKYESDVQDAIKPIKDRYIDDLKALLRSELDKGDADAVVAVKNEIKKMEAESPYLGKWTSNWNGVGIIQFKSDGKWTGDWNGNHVEGHWEVDKDGGVVTNEPSGWVFHYQINSQGHLTRTAPGTGPEDYAPIEDQ